MTTIPTFNCPEDCPVQQDTALIQGLSKDLTKTMRKLRRDVANCVKCAAFEDCPFIKEFNTLVQEVIQEINDEWERTREINQES
jgi:hypothetical protein